MFTRQDVWTLTTSAPDGWHPIVLAYAKAVGVMKQRSEVDPNDPTGWVYQAARHASPLGIIPGNTDQQCQHRSWFFLPWHRLYLYYFERIVRATMSLPEVNGPADFALPYWNYDQPTPVNTLPTPFRQERLPDRTPNPLFVPHPDRAHALNQGWIMPPEFASSDAAMNTEHFAANGNLGFGGGTPSRRHSGDQAGALEKTPHNDVHSGMGGFMGHPLTAALDPIFWLHHANIDRLWNQWLASPKSTGNPTVDAWRNDTFEFHDESKKLVTRRVKDVLDSAGQLNYRYDDQGALTMAPPPSTPPPPRERREPLQVVGASEESLRLEGRRASIQLTVPRETLAVAARAGDLELPVVISVDDITAERNPALVYGVYLTPIGDENAERFHVGNLSLFGVELWNDLDREEHGEGGFRIQYDATDVVTDMRNQGVWNPESVTVEFEPLRFTPPPGEDETMQLHTEVEEVVPVGIGRVSLLVG